LAIFGLFAIAARSRRSIHPRSAPARRCGIHSMGGIESAVTVASAKIASVFRFHDRLDPSALIWLD